MSYEISVDPTLIGYVAHVVDHEGEGPRGEGKSEMSALVDLCINLADGGRNVYEYHDALLAMLRQSLKELKEDRSGTYSSSCIVGFERAISDVEGVL